MKGIQKKTYGKIFLLGTNKKAMRLLKLILANMIYLYDLYQYGKSFLCDERLKRMVAATIKILKQLNYNRSVKWISYKLCYLVHRLTQSS